MAGIDVSYDENGQSLIIWFDSPVKEHHAEKTDSGMILKKDSKGYLIGVEHATYFASSSSGGETGQLSV